MGHEMKKYSDRLQSFLVKKKITDDYCPSPSENKIFRSLKVMGERATKGRDISECSFDVQRRGGTVTIRMILEGRHSMSVGHQVARKFEELGELEFVDVVKTKKGAKVVLRPREQENA